MKKLLVGLIAALGAAVAMAGEVGSYPNASALAGSERILADQGGVTKNMTPSQLLTYILGQGIPLTSLPTEASPTVLGNYSGSTATPTALNPLALANMQSAVIAATVVATTNITLSGSQTIDNISVGNGQTVLVAGQTTSSQNGIYVSSSGAWTRAANFPAGYVIQQNCDLSVFIEQGNSVTGGKVGTHYQLQTSAGAITIGTTNQTWLQVQPPQGTTTTFGVVKVTNGAIVASMSAAPNKAGDCTGFADAAGSVSDPGNWQGITGPCVITDVNGHPIIQLGIAPTVTGTGCSLLDASSSDNSGSVAATGVDTCVITFSGTGGFAFYGANALLPHCTVSGHSATVLPFISTAPTATSFQVHTAAAGNFSYICL